jgi:hypothetical protein
MALGVSLGVSGNTIRAIGYTASAVASMQICNIGIKFDWVEVWILGIILSVASFSFAMCSWTSNVVYVPVYDQGESVKTFK